MSEQVQHIPGTWKAIDIEIYEIDDLGNPGNFIAMARDQRVAAWMADTHNSMLAALKDLAVSADTAVVMMRREFPAEAQSLDGRVTKARAAIAKAEGTKP